SQALVSRHTVPPGSDSETSPRTVAAYPAAASASIRRAQPAASAVTTVAFRLLPSGILSILHRWPMRQAGASRRLFPHRPINKFVFASNFVCRTGENRLRLEEPAGQVER